MVEKFLEGKGALITGGASGFGRSAALEFAKRGANLVLVDINEELLEETTRNIETETNQKVVPIICDVSDSNQVKKMGKQAFEELENLYVLFNNAGIGPAAGKSIIRINERDWDLTFNVNLKGQWLVSKFLSPKMRRQNIEPLSGKIIHTASIAGMDMDPMIPAYSISKSGIISLVQLLAKELAPNVTVNAVSPGYHVTGIYANSEDTMVQTMKMGNVKTPLNRLGTIKDIVDVVLFLASSASDFITGHNFPVDGGIAEVGVPASYLKSDF